MNKEEIFKKVKKESLFNDESQNNKRTKGRNWGSIALTLVTISFWIASRVQEKDSTHLFAILLSYIAFEELGKYKANKEKLDLVSSIGALIMFVAVFFLGMVEIWNL